MAETAGIPEQIMATLTSLEKKPFLAPLYAFVAKRTDKAKHHNKAFSYNNRLETAEYGTDLIRPGV